MEHLEDRNQWLEVRGNVLEDVGEVTQGWHQGQTTTQRL